jgi:tetratricopeptide (TPR) repeat protein
VAPGAVAAADEGGPDPLQEAIAAERWDDAIAAARATLEADPDDPATRAGLGTALLGKARQETQVVIPSRLEAAKQSGDAAAFLDPSLFRTEVTYDEELREEAGVEFRRALELDPDSLEAYLGLARVQAEDAPEQLEVLQAAAKRFAGDDDVGAQLLEFGVEHFRAGRVDLALPVFEALSAAYPDLADARLDLGAALFATAQYDRGIAALERLAADHPEDANVLRALAPMYMFRLRWDQAAARFAQLRELEEDDRWSAVHEAAARMPFQPDAAKALLQTVIDADPQRRDPVTAVASNLLTALTEKEIPAEDLIRLATQLNQFSYPQLAVAVTAFLRSREPRSIASRVMLAYLYDNLRYYDLALQQLDEAKGIIRADPEAAAPYTERRLAGHYGRVYFNMQQWEKAAQAFATADDLGPLALAAGITYEKLGNYPAAYAYFQQVVDGGGPEALVGRARSEMDKPVYAPFRKEP